MFLPTCTHLNKWDITFDTVNNRENLETIYIYTKSKEAKWGQQDLLGSFFLRIDTFFPLTWHIPTRKEVKALKTQEAKNT